MPELASQPDNQPSNQSDIQQARIKRTFYLPPEDVLLLSELQLAEYRQTGKKPELSTLVSEAIRLLCEQRASTSQPA